MIATTLPHTLSHRSRLSHRSLRSQRARRLALLSLATLGLALSEASPASADQVTAQQCADSYVSAQTLRQDGDLTGARAQLLICASASCQTTVQKDCAQWLTEVDSSLPSVVFDIQGADVKDVHIQVDGVDVDDEARAGRALVVNPGRRKFTFKAASGKLVTLDVTVLEGQKNKTVKVSLGTQPKAGDADPPDQPPVDSAGNHGAGALPWVFVGVGAVGFGLATAFWLDSQGKLDDLDGSGCAPNCPAGDRDAVEQSRLIGDIGFGVGVVSLGVAVAIWLGSGSSSSGAQGELAKRATARPTALRFDVRNLPGGSLASIGGAF